MYTFFNLSTPILNPKEQEGQKTKEKRILHEIVS